MLEGISNTLKYKIKGFDRWLNKKKLFFHSLISNSLKRMMALGRKCFQPTLEIIGIFTLLCADNRCLIIVSVILIRFLFIQVVLKNTFVWSKYNVKRKIDNINISNAFILCKGSNIILYLKRVHLQILSYALKKYCKLNMLTMQGNGS